MKIFGKASWLKEVLLMGLNANDLKNCLNECIGKIIIRHDEYTLIPGSFSRTRKWPLDRLIHFILSFGSQSLGKEILEYFLNKRISLPYLPLYNSGKSYPSALWRIFSKCHLHLRININLYPLFIFSTVKYPCYKTCK